MLVVDTLLALLLPILSAFYFYHHSFMPSKRQVNECLCCMEVTRSQEPSKAEAVEKENQMTAFHACLFQPFVFAPQSSRCSSFEWSVSSTDWCRLWC